MQGILKEIVLNKKHEVHHRKQRCNISALMQSVECVSPTRNFHSALKRGGNEVKLLAEIKAASPSSGAIREDFPKCPNYILHASSAPAR